MATPTEAGFVPTSEAAFIADISDSEMNRMVDEDIVPRELVRRNDGRRFSRLSAAFASFYLKTDEAVRMNELAFMHSRENRPCPITVEDGRVVIAPEPVAAPTLEERLARFDPSRHGGEVMGAAAPLGAEPW